MSRRGLGRGLDALLPAAALANDGALRTIPVGDIAANPHQPRKAFDADSLEGLAASIRSVGLIQPVVVREGPSGYELVAGERRLRAARLAGLADVPALVVETDDRGSLERALVENLHRKDLNPIEEAAAYRELLEATGLTQDALGRRLGRGRATIANSLRLLDLPEEIQRLMISGRLSGRHGKALLQLQGNPFQVRLAQRAAHEGLTVAETEDLIRRYREIGERPGRGRADRPRPPGATDIERALADLLHARVRVQGGARKGRIVVEFTSEDDLARLAGLLLDGRAP